MTHKRAADPMILITGIGRSGTTWLGKIFDSHPQTLYRNEPESEVALDDIPTVVLDGEDVAYQETLSRYVDEFPSLCSPNVTGILPVFRKSFESFLGYQCRRAVILSMRCLGKCVGDLPVPSLMSRRRLETLRLVWKSVASAGRLNVFLKSFDRIHIIHILRHPCGVLASRLRGVSHGFKPMSSQSWRSRRVEQLLDTEFAEGIDIGKKRLSALTPAEVYMLHWALVNAKAMKELEGVEGSRVIRYEDLCEAPLAMSRSLFAMVGLPWNRQTETFILRSTSRHETRYYSVFKNPRHAAEQWREELSQDESEGVAALVRHTPAGRLFYSDAVAEVPVKE